MTKWEYRSVLDADVDADVQLNELGKDGWELVAVPEYSTNHRQRYVFKRPLIEKSAQPITQPTEKGKK